MSHLFDAPLLKIRHQQRRHSDTLEQPIKYQQDPSILAPFEDNSSPSSSSSTLDSRRELPRPVFLRSLLLPAELQLRKLSNQINHQKRARNLVTRESRPVVAKEREREGPKFYNFLPKRAPGDGAEDEEVQDAVGSVDANTDCRDVVREYEGMKVAEVRRECAWAVAEARSERPVATTTRRRTVEPTRTTTRSRASRTTTRTRGTAGADSRMARIAAVSLTVDPTAPLASIESNVNQIFSEAESIIASRSSSRAALATSVSSLFSEAASQISSRSVAATRSTQSTVSSTPSSTTPSTSTTSQPSSTESTASSSSPSSSTIPSQAASTSNNHRVRNIVVPSVVIPIGLLILFLIGFFCWRKRKRRNAAGGGGAGYGRNISGPRPLRLAANYGAAGAAAGGAGAAAMSQAGRGAGGGGARPGNRSDESLGTTPSAIGVALSEPRSKWGRRSLQESLAGAAGVAGATTGSSGGSSPGPGRGPFGGMHSRQESLSSSMDRGVGGYNSKAGYRPGMPRPFSPVNSQDPFADMEPPMIIPVPAPTQRPASLSSNSDQSAYARTNSDESVTARFARPITAGYLFEQATTPGVESRTSTEGEQGYWTAEAGYMSSRANVGDNDQVEEEELSPEEEQAVAAAEPVNFGSGSSNSSGGSTPVVGGGRGSASSTPRLGSGHGSRGYRRGDGKWWN